MTLAKAIRLIIEVQNDLRKRFLEPTINEDVREQINKLDKAMENLE